MPEADARWLFQQLLVAVEYCHLLGIANRDVKVPTFSASRAGHASVLALLSGWTREPCTRMRQSRLSTSCAH